MMSQTEVVQTAINMYLQTQRPVKVSDLATACHTNTKRIHDVLARAPELETLDVEVAKYDHRKGYNQYWIAHGVQPTRQCLCALINQLQANQRQAKAGGAA